MSSRSIEYPKSVNVVELESAAFKCAKDADAWARNHGIVGLMSNVDTGGKGEISISVNSLNKMLSGSALRKSVTPSIHFAALQRLRDIIRESFIAERHPDYAKVDGVRSPAHGTNRMVDIVVLYGCVSFGGIAYRAKTTLKDGSGGKLPRRNATQRHCLDVGKHFTKWRSRCQWCVTLALGWFSRNRVVLGFDTKDGELGLVGLWARG